LFLTGAVRSAHAADEEAAPASTNDAADSAAAPGKAAPPPVPPSAPTKPEPDGDSAVGLVERLPPSAYLAPMIRGLHGGSLWLNSQGAQWPYLPRTTIGVSGYAWLDNGYKSLKDGNLATGKNRKDIRADGRAVLRLTPTYSRGDWFVQAQAELVANKDQTQGQPSIGDTDDLWIRVGKWQAYDLTVGRFEAFEVYHLGMGLDINTDERKGAYSQSSTPPALYGASFLYYRPDGPGNLALHVFPSKQWRIEVLGQAGAFGIFNAIGSRTAVVFDAGWLKLKAGGEYQVATDPQEGSKTKQVNRGFAGSAQFVIDPYVEFGANAGQGLNDLYDSNGLKSAAGSKTVNSFGGFVNARIVPDLLFGAGVNNAHATDLHLDVTTGKAGEFNHLQTFAALQYFWESQLMIKFVFSYAKADFTPTLDTAPYTNKMYSGRLRFEYLF
jgi:hypothetical protein